MPDQNKTLLAYITTAINDFDSIFTTLHNKQVFPAGTATEGNTGIRTSEYSTYINEHLIKVNGLKVEQLEGTTGGVLAAYTTAGQSATAALNIGEQKLTISGIKAGYYSTAATFLADTTALFEEVTPATVLTKTETGEVDPKTITYVYQPSKIVSKITLDAAKITAKAETTSVDPAVVVTANMATTGALTISKLGEGATAPEGSYQFTITRKAALSGKYTVNTNISLSKGYADGNEKETISKDVELSGLSTGDQVDTYTINKGSVTLKSVNVPSSSITATGITLSETDNGGYAVNASLGVPTILAETTAGYVEGGKEVNISPSEAQWNGSASTKYIAKATISAPENAVAVKPTFSSSIGKGTLSESDAANNFYKITATNSDTTVTPVITDGYIKSTETKALPVKGESTDFYIEKGATTAAISKVEASSTSEFLTSIATKYAVSLNLKATAAGTITKGYQEGGALTIAEKTDTGTLYIKEGSATLSGDFKTSFVNNDDGLAEPETSIILSSLPVGYTGDYYTITDNHYVNVAEGYVTSGTTQSTNTYYIPRASLEYIEATGNKPSFFQVKQGGFIPSGVIAPEIIEGTLDEAVVAVEISATGLGKLISTEPQDLANFYTLTFNKGATTNAGYISASQGTLTGKYYLEKGKSTASAAITEITKTGTEIAKNTSGKYEVEVKATGTLEHTVTEGYVTADDKTTSGLGEDGALTAKTAKIELEAAEFELKDGQSLNTISVAATGFTPSNTATGYYVQPTLYGDASNVELKIGVKTAGYAGIGDEITINPTLNATDKKVYIKQGTKLENVNGTATVTLENDFAESKGASENYTIKIVDNAEVAVSGTLAEGYYASADEKAVTGKATPKGSISVTHGSVNVAGAKAALSVESSDVRIETGVTEENIANYYQLTPKGTGLVIETPVVTQGYVKSADVTVGTAFDNNSATKYYVKKFAATEVAVGETKVYTPAEVTNFGVNAAGEAVNEAQIATADTYLKYDVKVTLHEDAMGTNVTAALAKLGARLAGTR